jgi:hypothetical protein
MTFLQINDIHQFTPYIYKMIIYKFTVQDIFCDIIGVDDAESECGLDEGITWDYVVKNNGTQEQLKSAIKPLIDIIKDKISDVI